MSIIGENFHLNGEGVPEVSPETLLAKAREVKIIDVRRPEEFTGELGHIEGAELSTLGPDLAQALTKFSPEDTHVFVCRSGARSSTATAMALQAGLKKVFNMQGGMLAWNARKLPLARPT